MMSNIVLNDVLERCFSYPFDHVFQQMATTTRNASGSVVQVQKYNEHDWISYNINYNLLSNEQRDDLARFFQAIGFDEQSFLIRDVHGAGYFAERNEIGVYDGSTEQFQLIQKREFLTESKTYERWEIIDSVEFPTLVWVNGSPKLTGWTVNQYKSGKLTFSPGELIVDDVIEASFYFWRRVRLVSNFGGSHKSFHGSSTSFQLKEEGTGGSN